MPGLFRSPRPQVSLSSEQLKANEILRNNQGLRRGANEAEDVFRARIAAERKRKSDLLGQGGGDGNSATGGDDGSGAGAGGGESGDGGSSF